MEIRCRKGTLNLKIGLLASLPTVICLFINREHTFFLPNTVYVDLLIKSYELNCPSGRSLSRFPWNETTRSISTPLPDGMLVHRRVTPSSKFAGTHLYTWVERGTMRVKCLAQEHNAEPGPPDPESSALPLGPQRLPRFRW